MNYIDVKNFRKYEQLFGDNGPAKIGHVNAVIKALNEATSSVVSSIIPGTNITITPVSGTGAVTINASGGGSAYKVYTALISQSGTSDPTAVILENTLGAPVTFSRIGDGTYFISCSEFNFFTVNKTFICPIVTDDVLKRYTMRPVSPTTIELQTFNNFTILPPLSSDGLLSNDGIEIRVYT